MSMIEGAGRRRQLHAGETEVFKFRVEYIYRMEKDWKQSAQPCLYMKEEGADWPQHEYLTFILIKLREGPETGYFVGILILIFKTTLPFAKSKAQREKF